MTFTISHMLVYPNLPSFFDKLSKMGDVSYSPDS